MYNTDNMGAGRRLEVLRHTLPKHAVEVLVS